MVNIKTYSQLSEDLHSHEDYIIAVPSGQVIDMMRADALRLGRIGLCIFDYDNTKHYICDDKVVPIIYDYLWRDKIVYSKSMIEEFMGDLGFLRDQFRIHEDLSVDAYAPVNMTYKKLFKIPFKFNLCTSDFNCSFNKLLNLTNSPRTIHGNFNCSFNYLTDLVDGPRLISKAYNCSNNKISSLKGSPLKVNAFNCSNNSLRSLEGGPEVKGILSCFNNPFEEKIFKK